MRNFSIDIYLSDNLDFESNGNMTLTPIKIELEIKLNGCIELYIEHKLDELGRWEYLHENNITKCKTPWSDSKQLFRIYKVVKMGNIIKSYARHIYFDLIDSLIIDSRPTNKTAQEALNIIFADTKFTPHTNLTKSNTAYYIRKNIIECLFGKDENSFTNRWGNGSAELFVNNFDIYIQDKIGIDNNVHITYGKNLTSIEEDTDIEDVVTRIVPIGYDGIMLDGNKPWVDSPNIGYYPHPKVKEIKFDKVKIKTKPDDEEGFNTLEEAQAELVRLCDVQYDNGIDAPKVTLKVKFEELSKTVEYKDYKILETVNLGDYVYVKHNKLKIESKTRCVGYKWNVLTEKYIEVYLGDVESNYFSKLSNSMNSFYDDGSIKSEYIKGIIDGVKTQFKVLSDIAQKQHVRAILFEDLDPESPSYGAMALGTLGFEIASKRNPENTAWEWTTFGTGKGFYADCIVAGTMLADRIKGGSLAPLNGNWRIDLEENDGLIFMNGDKREYQIDNAATTYYAKDGTKSGRISSVYVANNTVKGVCLNNFTNNSYASISYSLPNDPNAYNAYMLFDKGGMHPNSPSQPISFWQNAAFMGTNELYFSNDCYIYRANTGRFAFIAPHGFIFGTTPNNPVLDVPYDNSCIQCHKPLVQLSNTSLSRSVFSISSVNYYSQSTQEILSDLGEAEIGESIEETGIGEVLITLSMNFINQIESYQVFTTCYGEGSITSIERGATEFKIKGTPGLKFGYEIKGKKVGE